MIELGVLGFDLVATTPQSPDKETNQLTTNQLTTNQPNLMASIFSKIVSGEISSHKIAETVDFLAFLDVQPLTMGHVLVIPKKEVDYIFDLDDELYAGLMIFTRIVAGGLKLAVPCKKVGVAVIGLEVPHAHIHLIPMNRVDDMNFSKAKLNPTEEELSDMALKIRENLKSFTES